MFEVMARKNKLKLAADALPTVVGRPATERGRHREHRAGGEAGGADGRPDGADAATTWKLALEEFIPSAQGLEKELQEIAAVLECTQMSFLPPAWRQKMSEPDGRTPAARARWRPSGRLLEN